ncbi:MAG: hypothetical protein AB1634_12065 [Thermodesulfobacteriota bacterium]
MKDSTTRSVRAGTGETADMTGGDYLFTHCSQLPVLFDNSEALLQ